MKIQKCEVYDGLVVKSLLPQQHQALLEVRVCGTSWLECHRRLETPPNLNTHTWSEMHMEMTDPTPTLPFQQALS